MTSPEAHVNSVNCCRFKGIFRIGGQRNFAFPLRSKDYFLMCKRFWHEEGSAMCVTEEGVNLLEIFTITNDQHFLEKVCNNYLHIELAKINKKSKHEVIGLLRLPLHQFYIAYRDASMTNRLCDGEFPVLSTDAWVPILNLFTGDKTGEVECLLAIGTDRQIDNIRRSRKLDGNGAILSTTLTTNADDVAQRHDNSQTTVGYQIKNQQPPIKPDLENSGLISVDSKLVQPKTSKTSDLLNMLQKSLATPPITSPSQPVEQTKERNSIVDSFRIYLDIKSARCLPLNPSIKMKKKLKRSTPGKEKQARFPPGEEPNAYVTFQANEGHGPMVKSHEGMVYSTNVIKTTSNPVWSKSFHISLPLDYLINNKRFILKVWKKAATNSTHCRLLPSPMEDTIIGFAAIDFSTFLANVPVITDWYNIVDFNGHINGQIKVTVRPLDDLQKLVDLVRHRRENQVDNLLDSFETSLNINNMNLSRAIKRKLSELEEISQRLRARLLDVTANVEPEEDVVEINDEQLDEFEHDLNTIACEDGEDTDNFSSPLKTS